MKKMIQASISPILSRTLAILATATLLASCGSGSGSQTTSNPNTNPGGPGNGFTYQGPSPQTDDVQNFRIEVYDNLVEDRCGTCHGVDQAPMFLDRDDVNNAYNITLTGNTFDPNTSSLVDFDVPANSRLVTKVQEGHNCWTASDDACATIMTNYVTSWATQAGSVSNVIVLTAPPIADPGATKTFPADVNDTIFASTVYPLVTTYCASCHSDTSMVQQQPFFASGNLQLAYDNSRTRMDLENPDSSRFYLRLSSEFHNCWTDCTANGTEMLNAITAFADDIPVTAVDPALVTSKAVGLDNGVIASSGGRVETNAIALYDFSTGEGSTAFDISGVDPSLDLTLSGAVDWIGSGGIRITGDDGKAQATTANSAKLFDNIAAGTGEYAIEAWVVPANVTQEGPARIISYSGSNDARNFTLGQTLYNYNYLNRTSLTDDNGQPFVSTPDADEVLQATLQHVVVNYDPVAGRTIYVNGEMVSEAEPVAGGDLTGWNDSYAFVVGNEVSGEYPFLGSVRLLAIYNRTMPVEDILTNFDVGVGEKYFLLFSIADLVNVPDSFIVFEVQQFDDYSYLFNTPFFYVLSGDSTNVGSIPLQNMRIGINGKEAPQGQAYAKLDTTITGYQDGELGQQLSPVGTIIALENGPETDEFFLTFDLLGTETYARTDDTVISTEDPQDLEQALIGVKTFEEIDASLSEITGIPRTNAAVANTFSVVRQQMPTSPAINGFLSAHQMGITQLAVEYCNQLSSPSNANRAAYFPGFDFSNTPGTAFDATGRAQIIDPILENMIGHDIDGVDGTELENQPDPADVETELNALIDRLIPSCGGSCDSSDTRNIVTSVCAAASGSSMMLIQ